MVLAAPELVEPQSVEVGGELDVTLELQSGVLAQRVVRGEEGTELETSHPVTLGNGPFGAATRVICWVLSDRGRVYPDGPFGDVAQLAERYLCKVDVRGSIPLVSTRRARLGGC